VGVKEKEEIKTGKERKKERNEERKKERKSSYRKCNSGAGPLPQFLPYRHAGAKETPCLLCNEPHSCLNCYLYA
jgi:hypothetical protein